MSDPRTSHWRKGNLDHLLNDEPPGIPQPHPYAQVGGKTDTAEIEAILSGIGTMMIEIMDIMLNDAYSERGDPAEQDAEEAERLAGCLDGETGHQIRQQLDV